jgi:amino acid adenylation domain-containing protein
VGSSVIPRVDRDGPAPLSFSQERMFLLDRLMPGVPAYNVPRLARIGRTLDAEVLQQALDAVVQRHEILRTRIVLVDGDPLQEIIEHARVDLALADVTGVPAEQREAEALRQVAGVAWQPFDLGEDVLLRAALVHVGAGDDLLLLVNQHLASDHASGPILFAEVSELYDAIESSREPDLPELPIQFRDYAAWQRSHLSGETLGELVGYWRQALAGAPERLDLPADHRRPAAQSYGGGTIEVDLPPELVEPLRKLARSANVSLHVVLLAAYGALLHRYSGQADIVVGTPVTGRHHDEIARLVGYFSNMLALRADLGGDPTFGEVLQRVREATFGGLAHQELPFEKLIEELSPDRRVSHAPVFQVMFGFDVDRSVGSTFAGAPLERLPIPENHWSRFDLSLVVRERSNGRVTGFLEYSSDLFERSTAERMLGHFGTLLDAVGRDPEQPLSRLPILTAEERQTVLVDWNATQADFPHASVHELVAGQAARSPDTVAVECGQDTLTYGELDLRSNRLANELVSIGVHPGSLVAVCLRRGIDLVVSLLAVLKAGGAYVPIDPSYPAQRRAFMLTDSRAPVLLTQSALATDDAAQDLQVVCVDSDWGRIAKGSVEAPELDVDPEQLAYVIYTSGSTGVPKGVEIPHRALVNHLWSMQERPGLGAEDVLVAVTTLSFDIAGLELFLPLINGARVVIASEETAVDPRLLSNLVDGSRATVMQATPTTWQMLVDAGWPGRRGLKALCGGEALPAALADQLLDRGAELWNMYGPTETTIWSSVVRLERGDPITIGRPIANTTFYVLDEHRQPLPIGVPGELYIGGRGVAAGYRNQKELTAERFVRDRFSGGLGDRLYRTGDNVRWRENGALEYLARMDSQVKLRGFRIEPGEIEAVLVSQPGVTAAVALVREDVAGDRRLVAYVVGPGAGNDGELRRLLQAKLPAYMVPSVLVPLDALPMTDNRKIDRAALPSPDGARPTLEQRYAPAETPMEELLVELWQELLGIGRVGIDDDFFDLGGHSLLAMKMLARVGSSFGIDIPLVAAFEQSTPRELAVVVSAELLSEVEDDDLASLLEELEAADEPAR